VKETGHASAARRREGGPREASFGVLGERGTKPGPKPLKLLGRGTKKELSRNLGPERRIIDIGARFPLL
jgi:hypothetical protein